MDYSKADLEKFRKYGDVTKNGVAFDWWLASCEGAGFCLIREPHHTDADIALAKHQIMNDRDVVGAIRVASVSQASRLTGATMTQSARLDGPAACQEGRGCVSRASDIGR